MKVSFQLTMPNVGSWNGQWTGAAKKYYVVRSFNNSKRVKELLGEHESKSFYYNFGDGWGASVRMEVVDAKEASKRKRESAGFCGYEWMVTSIIEHGKIKCD